MPARVILKGEAAENQKGINPELVSTRSDDLAFDVVSQETVYRA